MSRTSYGRIDWFRLPAALMVIAIHTAPFGKVSPGTDRILTYGLGRIAVPFFLMTTGYFVLGPCVNKEFPDNRKYLRYLKKTLGLYGVSILLYLPVMVYAGKFPKNLAELMKMLVFDGTFYHLWYFPAVILGSALVMGLLKKCSLSATLTVTFFLYLMGLLGDSYYGVTAAVPFLSRFYEGIFQISSYTRNGIFYAPLFLTLGIVLTKKEFRCSGKFQICGLTAGLFLVAMESFWTDRFALQRHDSMYLFLPAVMYFLYQILLGGHRKAPAFLRKGTLILYVIHPLVILLVRGSAGILGLEALLVENSLIHYGAVCAGSLGIMAGCLYVERKIKERRKKQNV